MSKHHFDFSKENSWIFILRLEAARKKFSKMFNKEIRSSIAQSFRFHLTLKFYEILGAENGGNRPNSSQPMV